MRERVVLTRFVRDWLDRSQQPRVLHVFDRACNLSNEREEIISVVWPELGAGPFALVLAEKRPFSVITLDEEVNITPDCLTIGVLHIDLADAILWEPRPNWQTIQQNRAIWPKIVPCLQTILTEHAPSETAVFQPKLGAAQQELLAGLRQNNLEKIKMGASQLAGLGQGLTPTGDDFLVGAIIALWVRGEYLDVIELIVQTAVPRTTKLSAAWLCAAGRGELVAAWHEFFAGLVDGGWETAVSNILQIGHSSGYDALTGFTAVLETRGY